MSIDRKISLTVDFNGRSMADRAHAVQRPRAEPPAPQGITDGSDAFFEDLQRIEGSAPWRRLKDLYQYRPGTHYSVQNRLTHTIIAQNVGEAICRRLGLGRESTDLVRAIVAAHDIGHAPFSHRGEGALQDTLAPHGIRWNHDMAGLRIVHEWAKLDSRHRGLNLTLDVLEGMAKRYWRFVDGTPDNRNEHNRDELPPAIVALDAAMDLRLGRFSHIEGQIAAISDWIAFTGTDVEDGLRIGELTIAELRDDFPLIADIMARHDAPQSVSMEMLGRQIRSRLIDDVVAQTAKNIEKASEQGLLVQAEDVRMLERPVVSFSPSVLGNVIRMEEMHTRKITMPGSREFLPCRQFVKLMADALIRGEYPMTGSWGRAYDRLRGLPPADPIHDAGHDAGCDTGHGPANDNGAPPPEIKVVPTGEGDRNARIAELVCGYLVTKITDDDVLEFLRVRHPDIHDQHFSPAAMGRLRANRPVPTPPPAMP